jgi:hypothetical protein
VRSRQVEEWNVKVVGFCGSLFVVSTTH